MRLLKAGYGTKKGKFGYVKMKKNKSMKGGKKSKRSKRGGLYSLSPSNFNGKGVGTSGVALQFVAGNASS